MRARGEKVDLEKLRLHREWRRGGCVESRDKGLGACELLMCLDLIKRGIGCMHAHAVVASVCVDNLAFSG